MTVAVMHLSAASFAFASEDGTLLDVAQTAAPRNKQLNWNHLCRLLAYLIKVSDCEYPEVELEGVTVVALKRAKLIAVAVLFQPSPDLSLLRVGLHELTAKLAHTLTLPQQVWRVDTQKHSSTKGSCKGLRSQQDLYQLSNSVDKLDTQQWRQQLLLYPQPLLVQSCSVTNTLLAELHPLQGLVTLVQATDLPCKAPSLLAETSGEVQHSLLVACQLLVNQLLEGDGKSMQQPALAPAHARRMTMATVKAQGAICYIKQLNTFGCKLFVIVVCNTIGLCTSLVSCNRSKWVPDTQVAISTAEPCQILLGKAAIPHLVQMYLQSTSFRTKRFLSVHI